MKRTGFKPKAPPPRPVKRMDGYTPKPRPVPRVAAVICVSPAVFAELKRGDGKARMVVPVPKAQPLRDESYRRWVASLPCALCRIEGYSQAAHADAGKGLSIKSSDDTCFPLCADRPGVRGCHSLIGASGSLTRDERRKIEANFAEQTRGLFKERDACQ